MSLVNYTKKKTGLDRQEIQNELDIFYDVGDTMTYQ